MNYSSSPPAFGIWHRHGDLSAQLFFQGENKNVERGENHYKSGHVESFSYVGLVYASRRERDVAYETCGLSHCVFFTAFN